MFSLWFGTLINVASLSVVSAGTLLSFRNSHLLTDYFSLFSVLIAEIMFRLVNIMPQQNS